jgi:hypothetical protein
MTSSISTICYLKRQAITATTNPKCLSLDMELVIALARLNSRSYHSAIRKKLFFNGSAKMSYPSTRPSLPQSSLFALNSWKVV